MDNLGIKSTIARTCSIFLQSRFLMFSVILILALKIVLSVGPINFPQNIFFADITKSTLENLINQSRISAGLAPLSENEKLNVAAGMKAQNMVQEQYFNHTSPSGVSPWHWFSLAGYRYKHAGENLAVGFFESEEVYQAWLNSPSHRANILSPNYTEVGTAVVRGFGGPDTVVVVQEFGSPVSATQPIAPKNPKTASPITATTKTEVKTEEISVSEQATSEQTEDYTEKTPRVLSGNIESKISARESSGKTGLISRIFSFLLYEYYSLIKSTAYGLATIVAIALILLVSLGNSIKTDRNLVFRIAIIGIVLSGAMLIDRDVIISLVPHTILI